MRNSIYLGWLWVFIGTVFSCVAIAKCHRSDLVRMEVTAYCSCQRCCGKPPSHPLYGVTASGHRVDERTAFVAAPKSIPFGTLVTIPGYNNGIAVPVWDRGGAIKEGKLDVYFPTHKQARDWGRRKLWVVISR